LLEKVIQKISDKSDQGRSQTHPYDDDDDDMIIKHDSEEDDAFDVDSDSLDAISCLIPKICEHL
jgi:hypothetical protein